MINRDYMVKTDGYYGIKLFDTRAAAEAFCDKQTAYARVFETTTEEIHNNGKARG